MVRFQADADLNQIIVVALVRRVPSVDFRTAEVAHLKGLQDRDVLALAARVRTATSEEDWANRICYLPL
jgi:hypothetical protein